MKMPAVGLVGLMCAMGLMGFAPAKPIQPIGSVAHAADTSQVAIHLDGCFFFTDNEYFGRRIEGYTLPGVRLTPKVAWRLTDRLVLQGGVSWLHYWGAGYYPAQVAYGVLPDHSDTLSPLHLVPWLQARLLLTDGLCLTFGSLDPDGHRLPRPLYNPERLYAADPEQGLRLQAQGAWGDADLWVDWRQFIWNRSPRQERFTMGFSSQLILPLGNGWQGYTPLHFLAQHVGGQVLAQTTPIENHFNAAAGVGIAHRGDVWRFAADWRFFWHHQHGDATIPFSHGWGHYAQASLSYGNRLTLDLGYWYGERFVPLMGSALYSSLSSVDPTLALDPTQTLSLSIGYGWQPSGQPFRLQVAADLYYDMGERQMQWAIGCALAINPTIRLR